MNSIVDASMKAAEATAAALDAKVASILDQWSADQRRRPSVVRVQRELADPSLSTELVKACIRRCKNRRALTAVVSFRLTQADFAENLAKVQASGLTQSNFYRQHVLSNTTVVVARPRASADREQMLYLTSKAGNNLNQVARSMHVHRLAGLLDETTYKQILTALSKIERNLDAAVDRVD